MAMITSNENLRLKRIAKIVGAKERVLDIGCADKPNPFLNNRGVIALDLEFHVLPPNYSGCVVANAMDLPQPFAAGEFDAITAGEILEHLEDPIGFLRRCHDTLKPGGILALSTPNPNSPIERLLTITLSRRFFYTRDHLMLFPQRWLIRMLEHCEFAEVKLYSGGFPLPPMGLVPFPRPWCYQTIASAVKTK
jgi:SAM-dependent methyltransferase